MKAEEELGMGERWDKDWLSPKGTGIKNKGQRGKRDQAINDKMPGNAG